MKTDERQRLREGLERKHFNGLGLSQRRLDAAWDMAESMAEGSVSQADEVDSIKSTYATLAALVKPDKAPPKAPHLDGQLRRGTRVRATENKNEVAKGDEGTVIAAWVKANVLVKWDNGKTTTIHRKRLELATPRMKTVRNLMSGKEIEIAEDTPLCCDPSSETYWSM